MLRTIVLAMLALSLTLSACGKKETKKDDTPAAPTMTQEEAVVGKWQQGQHLFVLGADKTFRWEQPRACATEPCPVQTIAGTYKIQTGKIYLDPREGDDIVLEYGVTFDPRTLKFSDKAKNKQYSLPFSGN